MTRCLQVLVAVLAVSTVSAAQQPVPVPQPFPRPGESAPATEPTPPAPPAAEPADPVEAAPAPAPTDTPTEATLGFPIYPTAQYLESFDAGRGQRYYLFGTNTSFTEIVAYYRGVLKNGGNLVFDAPAIHMFEIGRFREDTMAFPPGVTVKDYAWNGSEGYINPKPGGEPARFRTIIQIVPSATVAAPISR